MAVINTYTDNVTAQGQINSQATGASFGAQVGEGMTNLGNALAKQATQEELSNLYVDMADARAKATVDLADMVKTAKPGDQTLVPRMVEGLSNGFDQLSEKYSSPTAQREFRRMAAELTSSFTAQAIHQQTALAAAGAAVDHTRTLGRLGTTVNMDPSQLDASLKQFREGIDNKEGIYSQIPQSERDRLKYEGEVELRYAAKMGDIRQNPEAFLGKVAPEVLEKFRMTARVQAGLSSTKPTTNAKVDSLAPVISTNASKYGIDGNILTAQLMAESNGDTSAVSSKGAKGVAQFMPDTAKRYNVDVTNDSDSVRGQANYMADLLKMFDGDYRKALAGYNWGEGNVQKAINKWGATWMDHAPQETKDYVAKIITNAGVTAVTGDAPVPAARPVAIGDKDFDILPWDKQYRLLQTAQQQVTANQTHDMQRITFAEQERKRAQEVELNNLLPALENNELTPQQVLQASSIDFQHKDYLLRAIRVRASKMDDTQPAVFNETLGNIIDGKITDPEALWDYVGKGISFNDVRRLQDVVKGKGGPLAEARNNFLKMAKSQITSTTLGVADPEGDKQYYNFTQEFQQVVKDKTQAGVPLSEMLDPKSKEYVGSLVDKYKRGPKERMNATANLVRQSASAAQPNVPPRQPNETPEQYLARTGGAK